MNLGDLAAVVVTVCVVIALVALIVVLTQAYALMRDLRTKLGDFAERAGPALSELAEASEMARTEIERLRKLLNVAQRLAGLVENAGIGAAKAAAIPFDRVRAGLAVLQGLGNKGDKADRNDNSDQSDD